MAIEKYTELTWDGLKDLIDSLNWFDRSEHTGNYLNFFVGESASTPTMQFTMASSPRMYFSHTGDVDSDGHNLYGANGGAIPYAYKTKNGILMSTESEYVGSGYGWAAILGKTNNGAIAVAMNVTKGSDNYGRVHTCAYGEENKGLESFVFRMSAAHPTGKSSVSQIEPCPIPTAPANGTGYIKGAVCLPLAPWDYYFGEVDIGGIRYVTNGYIALSDED